LRPRLPSPYDWFRLRRRAKSAVAKRLFRDPGGGPENTILVAGVARSGTTWLAEIIASQTRARIMFEPFYSPHVQGFRDFDYVLYMRPEDDNAALRVFAGQVLSGTIRDPHWVDGHVDRFLPRCRIVKDVRVCLFLRWLHDRFPQVPILFIIRHPCAMVASYLAMKWSADDDLDSMLGQPKLVTDHLSELMPVIRAATEAHEKRALVWCIENLVALRQFENRHLEIVRYEDLVLRPDVTIPRLFAAIKRPFRDSVFRVHRRPSLTVRSWSPLLHGGDPTRAWQSILSRSQIDDVMDIVHAFGLGHLYPHASIPTVGHDMDRPR
jgi:hypothetical protein